jgi:hypothetical protein
LLLYFTSGTTAKPSLLSTPRRRTRWDICRRCTGSGWSPGMCT